MIRTIDDGLRMMISARTYGRKVRSLIDSGATRCFVSPSYVTACGLKGVPRDVFLELRNGEKILSRGYVPDIPVVTADLTVKNGSHCHQPLPRCRSRAWNELASDS